MQTSQSTDSSQLVLSDCSFFSHSHQDGREDFFRKKGQRLISQFLPVFKENGPVMVLPKPADHEPVCLAIFYAPHRRLPLIFESNLPFYQFRSQGSLDRLAQSLGVLAASEAKGEKIYPHARVLDWKYRPFEDRQNREKLQRLQK